MRFPVYLLIAGFGSVMSLAAQEDQFASYHRAIEARLIAMYETGGVAPPKAPEIPAPPVRQITPTVTIADFARKFWGGRDDAVSAAVSRLQESPCLAQMRHRPGRLCGPNL